MQENRKVIFVAHSLGGLVVQDALWSSHNNAEPHLKRVSMCTAGIAFMGTPHHGADLAAWANFGTKIARIVKHANSDIVNVLKPGSEMLARIEDGFYSLLRLRPLDAPLAVTCFFEELPLPVVGKVVESDSAIMPGYPHYGIRANHMVDSMPTILRRSLTMQDMTKFSSTDDDGYDAVVGEIRRWTKEARASSGKIHGSGLSVYAPLIKCQVILPTLTATLRNT